MVWDADEQTIALLVEITDPATSRPIDVRIDVVPERDPKAGRTNTTHRSGGAQRRTLRVYGTYLGVVADEN